MERLLYEHARKIYEGSIRENKPAFAVKRALFEKWDEINSTKGKIIVVAIGKAGWEMGRQASKLLSDKVSHGIIITKYDHIPREQKSESTDSASPSLVGYLNNIELHEASHPVVDFNGICATKRALEMTEDLTDEDLVIFLVSGGGSALFENVSCSLDAYQFFTRELYKSGADIGEMNTLRKHISNVKGGRFAEHIAPAKIIAIVLSDVVGNDLSTIASGPATADPTTVSDCEKILKKYNISPTEEIDALIRRETPKEITNAAHIISGSVAELCKSAWKFADICGYYPTICMNNVECDIDSMIQNFKMIVEENKHPVACLAFIFGGEITVKVTGSGLGGRNQELALRCAEIIKGCDNMAVFCVGSDGTDGPTDAAGGYVDGSTCHKLEKAGISLEECLKNNDSYTALKAIDGLISTGPTGTNVNDLYVLLIRSDKND